MAAGPHCPVSPSAAAHAGRAPLSVQVGAGDLDGFQADTEEEEEEDGDCVMVDISAVGGEKGPSTPVFFPLAEGTSAPLPRSPAL